MGIFSASDVQTVQAVGKSISETLKDRWYKKQLEDFQSNEMAAYLAQHASLQAQMQQEEDPDAMAATWRAYGAMTSEFLTVASGPKYVGNPYIANISQQLFVATQNGLDKFLQVEEKFDERTPAGQQLAARGREAEVAVQEAQALKDTEAGLLSRRKRLHPAEFHAPGAVPKDQVMFLGQPGTLPAQWMANMYRPDLNEERKAQMDQVRREMAQKLLTEKMGQPKGSIGHQWGLDQGEKADLEILGSQVPEEEVRREWEKQVIIREATAMGIPPAMALAQFGDRYEEKTPIDAFTPMTGRVSDELIVKNLWGPDNTAVIQTLTGQDTVNIDKLMTSLPDDLGDLGAGPLQMAFHSTIDEGGAYPGTAERVETYDQLVQMLTARGATLVNAHIGGLDVPDSELDAETKQSRTQARKLYMAMVSKYAPMVALGLDIKLPNKDPGLGSLFKEYAPLKLLKAGADQLKGILNFPDEVDISK